MNEQLQNLKFRVYMPDLKKGAPDVLQAAFQSRIDAESFINIQQAPECFQVREIEGGGE